MNSKLFKLYEKLKKEGLSPEQESKILFEINFEGVHELVHTIAPDQLFSTGRTIYEEHDFAVLQSITAALTHYTLTYRSLDELLERDKQREKDGFPRKIRVGRLIKPGLGDNNKFVVIPTTVEEKLIHDRIQEPEEEGESAGGSGDGEEGEVIGEQPIREAPGAGEGGAGEGAAGQHDIESSAYDLGRILTEKFELPNLKDKGKKRSLTRYTYDLTDRHKGFGQILDKKATLREILETNIHLGNVPDVSDIDTTRFIVSPNDKVYRILSKEKDYESQAMVFFLRDYSGSMSGKPTELVVSQHVMIYSWLLFQYAKQVESRFIVHDTEAKEVPDFYTYYNSKVAGGTKVASAFHLVNEVVEKENLAQDYNIYVFHGTDGDDWDTEGKQTIPEIKQILTYASRVGITIAQHSYGSRASSEMEIYLKKSGLLEEKADLIRRDTIDEDADEQRLIEGIKTLIS